MPALPGPNYKGWRLTDAADALEALWAGVSKFSLGSGGLTVPAGQTLTVDGTLATTGAVTASGLSTLGKLVLSPETVTIVSGVATVTKSFVVLDAEGAGTTDQLDTITMSGAVAGTLLLLTVNTTDTITVDDANINLAAATRAIAPGGSLLLHYDGTEWTETVFTAATDNV